MGPRHVIVEQFNVNRDPRRRLGDGVMLLLYLGMCIGDRGMLIRYCVM